MAQEIIKTVIEMSLCGISVYIGSAIYNWGYRTGITEYADKIAELKQMIENQRKKIKELTEYISRAYCVNPFRNIPSDGPSFVSPTAIKAIRECNAIDKKHLRNKGKKSK